MRSVAVDICLALAVAAVWLACLAFMRLRTPLERLHCAAFVNVVGGLGLAAAVAIEDGLTSRTWKTLALMLTVLLAGAATTHAVGRAVYVRGDREG